MRGWVITPYLARGIPKHIASDSAVQGRAKPIIMNRLRPMANQAGPKNEQPH
jgi:hypothetical protein